MSKLKENIDRILGNSIRCLLPSFWWKRLFGMVVDEVDKVKNEADKVKNSIGTLEDGYKALEESKADADAFIMLKTTELDRMEYGAVYLVRGQQDSLKVNFWEHKSPRPDVLNWTIWFSNKTSLEVTSSGGAFQWEGGTPTIDLSNLNPNNLYRLDCTLVTVGASGTTVKYVKRVARIVEYGGSDKYDTFVSETSTNAVQNKVVTAELAKKQNKLVSGTSIKTINGTTLLGSGDIKVAADVTIDSSLSSSSTNPVQNKVVAAELNKINNAIKNGAGAISINVDTTAGTWSHTSDSVTQDKYLEEADYKGYELRINGVKRGFIGGIKNVSSNGIPSSYIRWTEIIPQQDLFSKSWINITFENYILRLGNDGKTKGFTKYVTKVTNNEISNSGVDESLRFDFAEYDLVSGEENLTTNRTRNYTIPKNLLDNVETLVALAGMSSSLLTKSSIKTLNGVSLVGDGDLQLGDGQTIVYDDTAVQSKLVQLEGWCDDLYTEVDAIWDEIDTILNDLSNDYKDIYDTLDELIDESNEHHSVIETTTATIASLEQRIAALEGSQTT